MKAFNETNYLSYEETKEKEIRSEICSKSRDYILSVSESEFKEYIVEKYSIQPLAIDYETEVVEKPIITKREFTDRFYGEKYYQDVYVFKISYQFTGTSALFRIKPDTWAMVSHEIFNDRENIISFKIEFIDLDPEKFENEKQRARRKAFENLPNANNWALRWNNKIQGIFTQAFAGQLAKYKKENAFYEAVNIKIDPATTEIFTHTPIRKIPIPDPKVEIKRVNIEPSIDDRIYADILKILYESGKSMERKPSLYIGKDEEGLRDQFVFLLETRYESASASGETFNRGGKTDIIIKYAPDGSNLFVAECKFWHGISEMHSAINQLFDRYLTWRDSKVALLLFVKNKDFSQVNNTMAKGAVEHPYFIRSLGNRGETSSSFLFKLPQDPEKRVFLEIMLFHYDKI